jgi:hypothetical protein
MVHMTLRVIALIIACTFPSAAFADARYPWLQGRAIDRPAAAAIAVPQGFERVPAPPGSFAAFLRGLPLKPDGTEVRLHDGRKKCFGTPRPGLFDCASYHVAVIDIDTGKRDLQQCADAVMRLRAEYLLGAGRTREIAFNYTNGKRHRFPGGSYSDFRRYMDRIFTYAGSYSLEKEMRRVSVSEMQTGDVFIQGGFPGHAVLVVDMAENRRTGEKRFLLMQSYMPAQDMHILANPKTPGSGWYPLDFGAELITPEWTFTAKDLRRFRE